MNDPARRRRVLLVDDTPDLLVPTRRRLMSLGYDVDTATDGRQALDTITANPPDAVVLDVMMPELNGFQVCRRIKQTEAWRGIIVILLTAKTGQADRFWGEQAGADAYLCKPVDAALLETELRRLLFG